MAALDGADVRITSALRLRYPIRCVAPMVGQCDGPFRSLCRRHGATLVYTEMLEAARFAATTLRGDAGGGVDAGTGRSSSTQRRGPLRRGLQEDWALCRAMVAAAAAAVPETFAVTVKLRVQYDAAGAAPSPERTVARSRASSSRRARGSWLSTRGRGAASTRGATAPRTSPSSAARDAGLGVPVLSNGNVRSSADVAANLAATGAAGVMVAEQLLRDPSLFAPSPRRPEALLGEYLDLLLDLERRGVPRDDGSTRGKDGAATGACLWGLGDVVAQSATRKGDDAVDAPRLARAVTFGCVIHAPIAHVHYEFLESFVQRLKWSFWIPVQYLNFRFAPVRHQLSVVLATSVVWTAFLSYTFPQKEEAPSEEP
ncbi:hypothetical protein JL720_7142 [Aureococcus anophagefferens]|nr:hypothetical protein JL720_7142 [Aureococcus anophagefferens]